MTELSKSPRELFEENIDNVIVDTINGIKVPILKLRDSRGDYFAIPANKEFAFLTTGQINILNYCIKEISYDYYKGEVAIIKAYYWFKV